MYTRVSLAAVDLKRSPITPEEELFISLLILHLNSAYHAIKAAVFLKPDGLRKDIQQFFSRPIYVHPIQKEFRRSVTEILRLPGC